MWGFIRKIWGRYRYTIAAVFSFIAGCLMYTLYELLYELSPRVFLVDARLTTRIDGQECSECRAFSNTRQNPRETVLLVTPTRRDSSAHYYAVEWKRGAVYESYDYLFARWFVIRLHGRNLGLNVTDSKYTDSDKEPVLAFTPYSVSFDTRRRDHILVARQGDPRCREAVCGVTFREGQ